MLLSSDAWTLSEDSMSLSGPGGQTIRVLDHLKVPHPGVRHRPRTHPAKKKREALCCTPCHVKVPLNRAGSAFTGGAPLTPCESQGGAAVPSGRTPGGCACRICGATKEEVEEGPVRDKRSTKNDAQAVALGSCSKEGECPASGIRKKSGIRKNVHRFRVPLFTELVFYCGHVLHHSKVLRANP